MAVHLDSTAIFLAITAAILAFDGQNLVGIGTLAHLVTVAYPILHLSTAGGGLIALLAVRGAFTARGGYVLLAGFALVGMAWVEWLQEAIVAAPVAGSPINYAFPLGILIVGIGGATWQLAPSGRAAPHPMTATILGIMPLVALVGSASLILVHRTTRPTLGLDDVVALTSAVACFGNPGRRAASSSSHCSIRPTLIRAIASSSRASRPRSTSTSPTTTSPQAAGSRT